MTVSEIWQLFILNLRQTTWWEFIGVLAGIASVYFSKKENIWVYPTGMVNTIIFICLSIKYHLFGEGLVNLYYTVMSIYGWILWRRKKKDGGGLGHSDIPALAIQFSTLKEWGMQIGFFAFFYMVLYGSLTWLKQNFYPGAIPWADAFASATAFTGMWLMARKKVESWWWWIATNISSIPLYFTKGLVFTSVQYIVLLVLAIGGLAEWGRKAGEAERQKNILTS